MAFERTARVLLWAVAAAVLVVGGVLLARMTRLAAPVPAPAPDAAAQTFRSPVEPDSIVLRDGTAVFLAPGSRVELAAGYDLARRDVILAGAARFRVRPSDRPFRVIAGSAVVQDLGAVFAVRRDPDGTVTVAVTQGSVLLTHAVARPGQGVTINAGERGVLSPDGRAGVEALP